MDGIINVYKRDPLVRTKIKDISHKINREPLNYQSEIGYDTLIQNVTLKELINIMGATIVDIDIKKWKLVGKNI